VDRLVREVGLPRAHASHPHQHDARRKLEPDSAKWRRAHVVGTRLQLPHPASLVSRKRERLQLQAHMTDMSFWILLTDLQPHQQCAAIIMRLGGAAHEIAGMMTPQEMTFRGLRNDVDVEL
jgi:hypothetical protein